MKALRLTHILLALVALVTPNGLEESVHAQRRYDPFGDGPSYSPRRPTVPNFNQIRNLQQQFDNLEQHYTKKVLSDTIRNLQPYVNPRVPKREISITPRVTPPTRQRMPTPPRQPQYVRPSTPRYQPKVVYRSTPTQNVITSVRPKANAIIKKITPIGNKLVSFSLTDLDRASNALLKESVKASDGLAFGVEDEVASLLDELLNQGGPQTLLANKAVRDAWQDLVNQNGGPSVDDLEKFLDKHHGQLTERIIDLVNFQIDVALYRDGLADNSLSARQRQRLLTNMESAANVLQLDWIDSGLESLNDLYLVEQLTETIPADQRAFGTLLTGAKHADFPMTFVSEMTGVSLFEVPPVPESRQTQKSGVLWNPSETGQVVNFVLAGQHKSLKPGAEMPITNTQLIEFDNGKGKSVRYRVGVGSYRWKIESDQWKLYRSQFKVVLDNSGYSADFHYIVDDQQQSIPAGEKRAHTSNEPIEIRFERGDGTIAKKSIKTGTYRIGIDADEERLDLFDEADVPEYFPEETKTATGQSNRSSRDQRVNALLDRLKSKSRKRVSSSPSTLRTIESVSRF